MTEWIGGIPNHFRSGLGVWSARKLDASPEIGHESFENDFLGLGRGGGRVQGIRVGGRRRVADVVVLL